MHKWSWCNFIDPTSQSHRDDWKPSSKICRQYSSMKGRDHPNCRFIHKLKKPSKWRNYFQSECKYGPYCLFSHSNQAQNLPNKSVPESHTPAKNDMPPQVFLENYQEMHDIKKMVVEMKQSIASISREMQKLRDQKDQLTQDQFHQSHSRHTRTPTTRSTTSPLPPTGSYQTPLEFGQYIPTPYISPNSSPNALYLPQPARPVVPNPCEPQNRSLNETDKTVEPSCPVTINIQNLKCLYTNADQFPKNFNELKDRIRTTQSRHHSNNWSQTKSPRATNQVSEFAFPSYNMFSANITSDKGRGIMVYIKDKLKSKALLKDWQTVGCFLKLYVASGVFRFLLLTDNFANSALVTLLGSHSHITVETFCEACWNVSISPIHLCICVFFKIFAWIDWQTVGCFCGITNITGDVECGDTDSTIWSVISLFTCLWKLPFYLLIAVDV